jgi:hypothetical protein
MREEQRDGGLSEDDRELEGMLRSLAPRSAQMNPLAAAFDAGRISQQSRVRAWRSVAVLMLLVGAAGWVLQLPHQINSSSRNGSVVMVRATPPVSPLPDHSLLMIQQAVGERGVDALPASELPNVRSVSPRDLL